MKASGIKIPHGFVILYHRTGSRIETARLSPESSSRSEVSDLQIGGFCHRLTKTQPRCDQGSETKCCLSHVHITGRRDRSGFTDGIMIDENHERSRDVTECDSETKWMLLHNKVSESDRQWTQNHESFRIQ